MDYNQYISLHKEAAIRHIDIQHEQVKERGGTRNSFFTESNDRILNLLSAKGVDTPCMVLNMFNGGLRRTSDVKDILQCSFEILQKVGSIDKIEDIKTVYDNCKQIAMEIMYYLNDQFENETFNQYGVLFDMDTVQYDVVGPRDDLYYGVAVRYQLMNEAFDMASIDINSIFPPIT
jgi:hypothetical protein